MVVVKPARKRRRAIQSVDLMALKEGQIDPTSNVMIESMIVKLPTIVLFVDDRREMHLHVTNDHQYPPDRSIISEIENSVRELRLASRIRLEPQQQGELCSLLGQAIALAYTPDEAAAARQAAEKARQYLQVNGDTADRQTILTTSLAASTLLLLYAFLTWTWRADLTLMYGAAALLVGLSAFTGGLGACISVILRTATLPVASGASPNAYTTECIARVLVGAVAGGLVSLCVQGNLLLGFVNAPASAPIRTAAILVLALTAGISERVLPSIVGQVESNIKLHTDSGKAESR